MEKRIRGARRVHDGRTDRRGRRGGGLEQAGNIVAGQYVSKQLLNMTLRGRFLNLGRMLERIDQLPFKVTVTDVTMNSLPNERPELEIGLDMFLYVHE